MPCVTMCKRAGVYTLIEQSKGLQCVILIEQPGKK